MAQSWRTGRTPVGRPLDPAGLERLALRYVERYATSRARLSDYLARKLRERGWAPEAPAEIAPLVERLAALGYVDDQAFAIARGAALGRRGYGPRRVDQALKQAGIEDDDAATAQADARATAWDAALGFARRKRLGPFAAAAPDRAGRQKALATMLRAGHDMAIARRVIEASPGVIPEWDNH